LINNKNLIYSVQFRNKNKISLGFFAEEKMLNFANKPKQIRNFTDIKTEKINFNSDKRERQIHLIEIQIKLLKKNYKLLLVQVKHL
jgi:hypothetical protein